MNNIITKIRQELKINSSEATQKASQRFFKEPLKMYGVKTPTVHKIGKEYYKNIKKKNKFEIFNLCEDFWRSGYFEESIIACDWSYFVHTNFEPADFTIFENWVKKYINNWASCDTFCNHTLGAHVEMYPEFLTNLKKWTKSKNRWIRRASAVTLIIPAKKGKFLKDIFQIADNLLLDEDDLVQKGYGWMLKSASQSHQKEVFNYIMKNKKIMPRTALRYAIEKMPKNLKLKAMEKEV